MKEAVPFVIMALLVGVALGAALLWYAKLRRTRTALPVRLKANTPPLPALAGTEAINTLWNPSLGTAIQELKGLDVSSLKDKSKGGTLLDHVAVGQIVQAVPFIQATIQGGRIARVIGPAHVLKGLDQGVLQQLGNTGGVTDSSGRIVGQLRFGNLQNVRSIAAPIAAWQIASLLTCQYYLNRITAQLASIEREIAGLRAFMTNKQNAELKSAAKTLDRIAELPLDSLSDMDKQDLADASRHINTVYEHILKNMMDHLNTVKDLVSKRRSSIDSTKFRSLLKTLESDVRSDAALLCLSMQGKFECLRLRLFVECECKPESADIRAGQVRREINDMRKEFQAVLDGLAYLWKRKLKTTKWEGIKQLVGGTSHAKELKQCKQKLRPLYEALQQLLPSNEAGTAIIDIGRDPVSGELIGTMQVEHEGK